MKKTKILIIEDDNDCREMISLSLRSKECIIFETGDGADGIRVAEKEKPDLVLLDIQLPALNGFEVLEQIVKRKIATRVIVISGVYKDPETIIRCIKLGACDFIIKPFYLSTLLEKVKRNLLVEKTINFEVISPVPLIEDLINETRELDKINKILRKKIKNPIFIEYDFHPSIERVSVKLFDDGHYKEAIQAALVEVITRVKVISNYPKEDSGKDLDGDSLMQRVFGCDGQNIPLIRLNQLSNSLDKAEQRGFMYLFKGIVGIRDKKAHMNFTQNDLYKAIEYLSLASLLMRILEQDFLSNFNE